MKYDKLIRDKIPEIIKQDGRNPIIHTADDAEYWQKLKEKLLEEIKELEKNPSVEELADILEVLDAIAEYKGLDAEEIQSIKKGKAGKRGKFKKRIILDEA